MINPLRNTILSATLVTAALLPLMGAAETTTTAAPVGQTAKPTTEMQVVLDALKALGAKPIHSQTVEQVRAQPTPADAVAAVMKDKGIKPGPEADIATSDMMIKGAAGDIPARVYTPPGEGPFPVIVYFHGGGWVIANIDTYDASARSLALGAKAVVVSSHYRQGPEDVFPAAHDDAYAAYVWAVENSGKLNGDAARMAVAGESAGANLAANVAIMARDNKITMPVHQLLVYPIAGNDMNTPSYVENEDAAPLGKADMAWFLKYAFARMEDSTDPRVNLVARTDLEGLPPATLITAQIDPLRSEGQAYGQALTEAGVVVDMKNYDGVTHEFFGMGAVVPEAKQAMDLATINLRNAFGN